MMYLCILTCALPGVCSSIYIYTLYNTINIYKVGVCMYEVYIYILYVYMYICIYDAPTRTSTR
jgi:hypothetical protein